MLVVDNWSFTLEKLLWVDFRPNFSQQLLYIWMNYLKHPGNRIYKGKQRLDLENLVYLGLQLQVKLANCIDFMFVILHFNHWLSNLLQK